MLQVKIHFPYNESEHGCCRGRVEVFKRCCSPARCDANTQGYSSQLGGDAKYRHRQYIKNCTTSWSPHYRKHENRYTVSGHYWSSCLVHKQIILSLSAWSNFDPGCSICDIIVVKLSDPLWSEGKECHHFLVDLHPTIQVSRLYDERYIRKFIKYHLKSPI